MDKSINQRIAAYRKLSNLTQGQVAEKLGLKTSTYAQRERKGKLPAQMVVKLAEIFGVSTETLLNGENSSVENYIPAKTEKTAQKNSEASVSAKISSPSILPLTNSEENIIKIIRNLSKQDKDEVMEFIEKKYRNR